jgi:hypothetical protein
MSQFESENKDVLLATALACGASASETARQLGVCLNTVKRRMLEPGFRKLVANLRAEMVECVLGRMTERLTRATDAVAELLDSPEPHIRLRAARILFHTSFRLRDAVDVDQRIRDLEEDDRRRQELLL